VVRRLAAAFAALVGRDPKDARAALERRETPERAGEAREPASPVDQINALYAAARILGSGADLPVIAAQTLEVIQTTTGMDAGTMVRLDRATDTLHLIAHRGLRHEHVDPLRVRRVEESALRDAVRTGRPIAMPLPSAQVGGARMREVIDEAGYRTLLALPIPVGGETWGVISLLSRDERRFDPELLRLLEAVAHQVGLAVARATLYADERTRRAHLAALLDINTKIGALAPTGALLASIAEEAARLLGVDNAGFRLLDGDELVLAGVAGSAGETMLKPRLKVGESFTGKVVSSGRAMREAVGAVPDIVPEHVAAEQRLGYTHILGVPLRLGARTIGALVFRARRAFAESDQELAEAFAGQAAVAIEHSRLYREASRREHEAEALAEVTRGLNEALDLDTVLQRVTVAMRELCAADAALIALREPGSDAMRLRHVVGREVPAALWATRLEPGQGLGGVVMQTGRPLRADKRREEPRVDRGVVDLVHAEDVDAALVVPILIGGRVEGLVFVQNFTARAFTDRDEAVLVRLADHAAVAVGNARLYAAAGDRAARLRTLNRLNHLVSSSLDTAEVLTDIARAAGEFMNSPMVVFWLADNDTRTVRAAAVSDPVQGAHFHGRTLRFGEGAAGCAARDRLPLNIQEVFGPGSPVAHRDWLRANDIRSLLAIPVIHNEVLLAVVTLTAREPFQLGPDDHELLESFLAQAAVAIRNAALYAETDRRRREAEVLAEVAGSINASLDLVTVLDRVVAGARELCGSDMARILLRETDSEAAVTRASAGHRTAAIEALRVEPGKGVAGAVLVSGKPFRTSNYAEDARIDHAYQSVVDAEGLVAMVAVPIVIDGRVEGVLHADNRTPRGFADPDEAVLARLADHAAVAIRNARLYRETSDFADRLRALDEVNRLVSSSLNPDEVLQNVAAAVARFFDAPWVAMWAMDELRQCLVRSFVIGSRSLADQLPTELPFGAGTVGWVAQHRQPLYWTDSGDARVVPGVGPLFLAHGLRYRLCYPITIGERVLGVFAVNRSTAVEVTPETEALLRSLAAQAALALDHARLFSETARRLEETRALLEVEEILNSTLNSKQLLKRAAIRIAQVCHVDRCSIERWDGKTMSPLMSQFADGQPRPELWARFAAQSPWTGRQVPAHQRVIDTRRPVVINDTSRTDLLPPEWIEWFSLKSWMSVPLVRQDQVIGVLNLDYCERTTRFEGWQVDLAMTIAGQLALSLENIRLYAEVQERLSETQTLLEVAETLSQPGAPEEIMRKVARAVGRATTADMVGSYFLNERKDQLVVLAGYHVPQEYLPILRQRAMRVAHFPFVADALAMGRPVWSPDALRDPRFDPAWNEGLPPHAVLFVPTLAQGQPVGGLFLVWWQVGRPFPAAELPLVEGVATQVGLALENAELSRQTRRKLRETEALLSVSRALASTLDLEAMLRHFMREAARTLSADTMAFWMAGPDGEWLEPFAGYHVPPDRLDEFRTLRVSMVQHAFYAEAVQRRRPALSTLGHEDPRLPAHVRALRHRSQLFVPIIARERVIGALGAVWWESVRELPESELSLLEAIASQLGVAVEQARLFSENQRQVQELSVLYDLSRAVTGVLDRAALVHAVHTHLERVMDVRNMVVMIRDEDVGDLEVALRIRDGRRDDEPPHRYPTNGVGLLELVLDEGRSLRTTNYGAECARRGVAPVPYALEYAHWLGVPMKVGDQVLGALVVRHATRPYTEADERLLGNIADLTALALRSARLYDERARAFGELSAAQDQLVRTEKLRALGEMASGVAHDFNNLLASILGRAQLLLQRIEDPRLRKWLQVIERSALDGASTVRRLQEFTRIRRDQPFVAVDVNQVVRDALEITQSRWREEPMSRGITIEVRTALGDVPTVAGDPVELREALTNLILNAVDAMPDGGALSLRTAHVGGAVELAVSDSGVGMPEGVRQRIFDPFFTTKGAQGTGLGLSITYGILMRHRARVVVESEPGQGTTFRLAFEPSAPVHAAEPATPIMATTTAALRCLVVDDEETVGSVLGDVLETSGHSAVVLTTGAEAIERFRRERFDVVFTDLAMPGLSGWQVARAVKATAPTVPVFLVTGFGVELSAEERRAHGVDLVLSKPLNIQSILDAVAFAAAQSGDDG
jgi:GAF domain-containing protein/ActR/RegA family two-component response regulator